MQYQLQLPPPTRSAHGYDNQQRTRCCAIAIHRTPDRLPPKCNAAYFPLVLQSNLPRKPLTPLECARTKKKTNKTMRGRLSVALRRASTSTSNAALKPIFLDAQSTTPMDPRVCVCLLSFFFVCFLSFLRLRNGNRLERFPHFSHCGLLRSLLFARVSFSSCSLLARAAWMP